MYTSLVFMYTLGAGGILIKSITIVCLLNLMAWKASYAHRTGENEKNMKMKTLVQTSSTCGKDNKKSSLNNAYPLACRHLVGN